MWVNEWCGKTTATSRIKDYPEMVWMVENLFARGHLGMSGTSGTLKASAGLGIHLTTFKLGIELPPPLLNATGATKLNDRHHTRVVCFIGY